MIKIGQDREIPAFPFIVAAGYIAIVKEPDAHRDVHGILRPHKQQRNRFAYIAGVGAEDGVIKMDKNITLGRRIVMPGIGKQEFEIEGQEFLLVYHKEVKVFDPIEDPDLLLAFLQATLKTVPDSVVKLFLEERKSK